MTRTKQFYLLFTDYTYCKLNLLNSIEISILGLLLFLLFDCNFRFFPIGYGFLLDLPGISFGSLRFS